MSSETALAEHSRAFRSRVSCSVAYRGRLWQALKVDGVNSDVAHFHHLGEALEWIKDQYRSAGVETEPHGLEAL